MIINIVPMFITASLCFQDCENHTRKADEQADYHRHILPRRVFPFALSGVAGNALVGRLSKSRLGTRPASVLAVATAALALLAAGMGVAGLLAPPGGDIGAFVVVVVLLVSYGIVSGIAGPVRQAYINEHIPSAQRATVLSLDSFFADVGAVGGQLGLGAIAQAASKAIAYTIGGIVYFAAVPLYSRAGRASGKTGPIEAAPPGVTETGVAGRG
mgnify:CR=1 FL=1